MVDVQEQQAGAAIGMIMFPLMPAAIAGWSRRRAARSGPAR